MEALDGGIITSHRGGPDRVQGSLAVTRALGDFWLSPYVISEPAVRAVELASAGAHGMILACDVRQAATPPYMSPGTQSQDSSSHKTTRVVCSF